MTGETPEVQLAKSSRAIHGGAYFSAVCGRKLIPINAPGPYLSQKQIHVTCFITNPFEMPTEQRKQCACECRAKKKLLLVGKKSSLLHSWHSYGPGALIGINFRPQTAEK